MPTLGQLKDASLALKHLISQPLTARTAFELGKLIKVVNSELATLEETRRKLIAQHGGILSEDKSHFDFAPDALLAFEQAFRELVQTEASVTIIPITRAELEKLDVRLSVEDILALDWLITETPQ